MWMAAPGLQLTEQQVGALLAHDISIVSQELSGFAWYEALDPCRAAGIRVAIATASSAVLVSNR